VKCINQKQKTHILNKCYEISKMINGLLKKTWLVVNLPTAIFSHSFNSGDWWLAAIPKG